jgi:MFS family permease
MASPQPDFQSRAPFRRALGSTFRAMRVRNYRLFWFGQLVSLSGTWMQRVAQAWLVLQLTDSPFALGTVSALQFTPLLLLSLFGGVVADRVPKRRLLVITQAIMAGQAVAIAILTTTGQIQLWHIYVLAALLGLANSFDNPSRQALVMEMVGPKDLPNAVALNSSLFNSARLIGPAVGGAIIAAAGLAVCFWLNAVSYLAVIGALLAMRPAEFFDVPSPNRGRMLPQLREGLAYALHSRDVCVIVILLASLGSFGYNFNIFLPLIARYVLDVGPFGLGVLFSCLGAGSVVAALTLASRREASERTLLVGATIFTCLLLLVALSSLFLVTAVLLLALGAASIVFSATANTRMQMAPPAALRGRVMSLYTLLFAGTTPLGSFVIGSLSERLGVQFALVSCAALCILGVLGGVLYARSQPAVSTSPTAASLEALPTEHQTAGLGKS